MIKRNDVYLCRRVGQRMSFEGLSHEVSLDPG
jgi:hypothetical protein